MQYSPGNRLLLVVYVFDALVGFYAIIIFLGPTKRKGERKRVQVSSLHTWLTSVARRAHTHKGKRGPWGGIDRYTRAYSLSFFFPLSLTFQVWSSLCVLLLRTLPAGPVAWNKRRERERKRRAKRGNEEEGREWITQS